MKPANCIVAYLNLLISEIYEALIFQNRAIFCSSVVFSRVTRLMRIVVALLLAANCAPATAIVAMRYENTVFVGTDSLIDSDPIRFECKIHQISRTRFVALGGMVDEGTRYNTLRIATGFARRPLASAVEGFYKAESGNPILSMARMVASPPALIAKYASALAGERAWLTAEFVEFDGGTTRMESIEIFIASKDLASFQTAPIYRVCPGKDCIEDGSASWRFSSTRVSDAEAKRFVDKLGRTPQALQAIISLEHETNSEVVAPTKAMWSKGGGQGCQTIY